MKQLKKYSLHLLFWIAILFWRAKSDYFSKAPFEIFLLHNLLRLPIMILATYTVATYLLPKYIFQQKRYGIFIVASGGVLWIATLIDNWLIQSKIMYSLLQSLSEQQYKWVTQLHPFRNAFLLLAIIGVACLIQFFKIYTEQEKRKNELIQENLETQYAFLKTQVNPHFLFNALNNIYSMAVQREQQDIALGIENLSGIMQYLTYESDAKRVPVKKEIELLQNYIDIEQLRFDDTDDTVISFQIEGGISDQTIAPVILLPLVENAFKHGIKPDHQCLVSIQLLIQPQALIFTTKNTVFDFEMKEIKSTGIGLENVKKRLDLQYKDQYTFTTDRKEGYFLTKLQLYL